MKPKLNENDVILVKDRRQFLMEPHGWTTAIYKGVKGGMIETEMKYRLYCVPLRKFNPKDMEQTKRHILQVKDGELAYVFNNK